MMVEPKGGQLLSHSALREGSVIDHIQLISVGDMIEAINGQSLLGCRHYEGGLAAQGATLEAAPSH